MTQPGPPRSGDELPDPPEPPRPGHGRVWVNGADDETWFASWQDEDRVQDSPVGTQEQAIAWAREMPGADRFLFSAEEGDYLPLQD